MKARFKGQVIALPNPAECPRARKPVAEITDRAKRYRANQPACLPDGPRVCSFCGSRRAIDVHHVNGNESDGRRRNLAYACRSCNTRLGLAFAAAGRGVRTRQYNPKAVPDFKLYAWAVGLICKKRDMAAGRCLPSSDPEILRAVAVIRATPAQVRAEYAARAAAGRGRWRSEVPF